MNQLPKVQISPRYVNAPRGRRYQLALCGGQPLVGRILFVHAFAEEMNKSRRMVAVTARRLAEVGFEVYLPDLYGCGDSEGDFGEAAWDDWVNETASSLEELSGGDSPVWVWAMRAGALIGVQAILRSGLKPQILLWQPVLSGDQHLQHFIRLGYASSMLRAEGGITAAELRSKLQRGEHAEIAGYRLGAELARGLIGARLALPSEYDARVIWLEASLSAPPALMPASIARIHEWQAAGTAVVSKACHGPPFWLTQETTECPALLQATVDSLLNATPLST